jgi:ECF transporter S component (folate family)
MKKLTTKSLVFMSLLIALNLVLGQFTIPLSPTNRMSIGFITTVMMALCFGPVYAGIGAAICDVLKFILMPSGGAFFPGFTLTALIGGMLYGFILYRKHFSWWRVIVARFLVVFFCNFLLNSYWLVMMGVTSQGFLPLALSRVPKYIILFPFEVLLMFVVWKYAFPLIHPKLQEPTPKAS